MNYCLIGTGTDGTSFEFTRHVTRAGAELALRLAAFDPKDVSFKIVQCESVQAVATEDHPRKLMRSVRHASH